MTHEKQIKESSVHFIHYVYRTLCQCNRMSYMTSPVNLNKDICNEAFPEGLLDGKVTKVHFDQCCTNTPFLSSVMMKYLLIQSQVTHNFSPGQFRNVRVQSQIGSSPAWIPSDTEAGKVSMVFSKRL